ncbi:MAG: phosphate ABC transporter ATP-binding protein [Oscillospiraceae bacterium]|nr:phosphate ABC transporter ATP-binding protein [Oscillospiraceae bacterium]
MASENKIEVKNFNFYFGKKQIISNLNLNIRANKITSVFGPANSGTTTFLRSLNRLCDLDANAHYEGEILIDGKSIFDAKESVTELRRRIGMVFEVPTPLPLSIFENVCYGLRLQGLSSSYIKETVETALKQAALWDEVSERLDLPAMSLSGGQQQRMCVARVLAMKPEVVLIDRACSGLDPISTAKIEESMSQLKSQYTIIISPHNVQQAIRVSDRAAFLLMGELIEEGTNEEMFTNPQDKRTSDYVTGRFG